MEDDVVYEIVSAIAAADDVAPTELEYTLAEYIAPEALVTCSRTPAARGSSPSRCPVTR